MSKTTRFETAATAVKRSRGRGRATNRLLSALVANQIAGHISLDFCNTAGEHLAERPDELLHDWELFVRWATQAGLIGPESYREAVGHPEPLDGIIRLREAVYRAGLAVAGARRISKEDLELIRECANVPRPQIELRDNRCRWRPTVRHVSEQLCALLASEALSLFCSPMALRIGVCDGGKCGWLFIDDSRGKRRRWCDMNDCGSRAKARRYYENHK